MFDIINNITSMSKTFNQLHDFYKPTLFTYSQMVLVESNVFPNYFANGLS